MSPNFDFRFWGARGAPKGALKIEVHGTYPCMVSSKHTGVERGGGSPTMARQKKFFVKIEGLLEPVVLNLSFRVRSNAMFTSEDDISVTDILEISKIT